MLETVEKMKKKGKFTKEDLAELGFVDNENGDIPPVPEDDEEDQAQNSVQDEQEEKPSISEQKQEA